MLRITPEREINNIASWRTLANAIAEYPDDAYWTSWKKSAAMLLHASVELGLDRYFRAGKSMHHIIFSTLEYNGLRDEPRVTVEIQNDGAYRIAYDINSLYFGKPMLEYSLPFEQAFPTFRRFLNQLWKATMSAPIPEQLTDYNAPIMC